MAQIVMAPTKFDFHHGAVPRGVTDSDSPVTDLADLPDSIMMDEALTEYRPTMWDTVVGLATK